MNSIKKELPPNKRKELLEILRNRFGKNIYRHKGLQWDEIEEKLNNNPQKLWSLNEMEETGGEPDVISFDEKTGEYIFWGLLFNFRRGNNINRKTVPLM